MKVKVTSLGGSSEKPNVRGRISKLNLNAKLFMKLLLIQMVKEESGSNQVY